MNSSPLILASASPRRAQLLSHIYTDFLTIPANIDEQRLHGEDAHEYVRRLAIEKADSVHTNHPNRYVLGSDTAIEIDGSILNKPKFFSESKRMLTMLSGKWHRVYTGIAILEFESDKQVDMHVKVVSTEVEMAVISDHDIGQYWETQEPSDKAGSYAIQGIGGKFVKQIRGSYSSVVGLPQAEVKEILEQIGILR